MEENCGTCKYFKPDRGILSLLGSGTCTRNPPKPWSVFHMAQRPQVYSSQSCGQWESKYDTYFGLPKPTNKIREPKPPNKTEELKSINKTDLAEPLKILGVRYAKGELTKSEFEKMKKEILGLNEDEPIKKAKKTKSKNTHSYLCPQCLSTIYIDNSAKKTICPECGFEIEFV